MQKGDSDMDFAENVETTEFDKLGKQLYADDWPAVRAHNIKRLKGDDPAPLGQDSMDALLGGLRSLLELAGVRRYW